MGKITIRFYKEMHIYPALGRSFNRNACKNLPKLLYLFLEITSYRGLTGKKHATRLKTVKLPWNTQKNWRGYVQAHRITKEPDNQRYICTMQMIGGPKLLFRGT